MVIAAVHETFKSAYCMIQGIYCNTRQGTFDGLVVILYINVSCFHSLIYYMYKISYFDVSDNSDMVRNESCIIYNQNIVSSYLSIKDAGLP